MNSLHIIGSKASGGAENFYVRLINSLAEKSSTLSINPPNSAVSEMLNPQVPQIHPPMASILDLYSRLAIRHAVLKRHPAIVQTYMGRATRLTHLPRNKGLVHVARLGGYYNLKAYRHAHHLIGNTKGICDYLIQEGVSKERVHYVGNFVEPILPPPAEELAALRQSLGIPDDAFVITCAARFHENKGLPDLLEAFSKLWNRLRRGTGSFTADGVINSNDWNDARLILVGDGPMADEIKKQIRTLGIESAVILPGWRDPKPYYHLADVLVSPSRWEPLGNTILEAWACGKPLVATATMGATELVTDGGNGLITPLKDPVALTNAFEQLMKEPSLQASLAEAGAKTINTHFSKEGITGEYINLYTKLSDKC